ncbi:M23 family metallopeptidase [Streptomyces incarnatus]|uniref:M23 family metallopeptidase n=1 Tax=Streptomyces incarnatus TaxID=665007 RepID=UPI000A47DA95|nr:M23 family metallopeptidase [Streptomyces incarnatus]
MQDLNRHGAADASPADALHRFLTSDPGEWDRLAPHVVRRVGQERLAGIVTATRELTGDITGVDDGPDGLVIRGATGQVLAWAKTDDDGVLIGLLIDGEPYKTPAFRVPPRVQPVLSTVIWTALIAWGIAECWTAGTGSSWLTDLFGAGTGYAVFEGYGEPASMRRWVRHSLEAGALPMLAAGYHAARLPFGHSLPSAAVAAAVCAGVIWTLFRRRRHRWGTPLSAPLRFPLRGGAWYVGQGGGKGLNHHFSISEQRGALDIVAVDRAHGRKRPGTGLESYLVYGAKLYAPCDGVVISAADGLPDQEPGLIRFGPLYGNHVFIDTGHEVVKMAHLRPGSVAVSTGQNVRAGQLVGEVGNSGNTTEPHLHLHAERDGVGLDLAFTDVGGFFHRGRVIRN